MIRHAVPSERTRKPRGEDRNENGRPESLPFSLTDRYCSVCVLRIDADRVDSDGPVGACAKVNLSA
jgi:hypothetical protein